MQTHLEASCRAATPHERKGSHDHQQGKEKAMAWEAPKGYALCPDSSCDRPVRSGQDPGHQTVWQCKPGDECKAEGCGCYLCAIAPGEKRLRIDARPGSAGYSRVLPPGWVYVCACMKEVGDAKDRESGWGEREDVGWLATGRPQVREPMPRPLPVAAG
jgi:hypothetical protein